MIHRRSWAAPSARKKKESTATRTQTADTKGKKNAPLAFVNIFLLGELAQLGKCPLMTPRVTAPLIADVQSEGHNWL